MARTSGDKTLAEKALATKSVYINDISSTTWNRFIGLTKKLDVLQTAAVEEALELFITKHKHDVTL